MFKLTLYPSSNGHGSINRIGNTSYRKHTKHNDAGMYKLRIKHIDMETIVNEYTHF